MSIPDRAGDQPARRDRSPDPDLSLDHASETSSGPSWALIEALRLLAEQALKGRPVREAIHLAARLIGARAMSVMTLVAAAWLVDIEAFAEFGVYQTLASLAWVAMFLRYDAAIVAARTEAEAGEALRLCMAIGSVSWLVFTSASLVAGGLDLMRLPLALLLPFSILARGMLRLSFAAATRDGDFKRIGRASLVQSVVQPTLLVALVLSPVDDTLSFAIADIAGHVSGVAYLAWSRSHVFQAAGEGWSMASLKEAARRWWNLPLFNLPSSFFSLAFVMSPLLVMPMAADAVFAGHVALAYRIFDVPTQIIAAASTPIFLNWLRPSAERPSAIFGRHLMLGLVLLLGSAYVLMAGAFLLADGWLQGSELEGLADAIPLIAMFQLFIALAAPLNDSCALYPQQRRLVLIQGLSLIAGFYAAFLTLRVSPEGVLVALTAVAAFRAFALGELLRRLSSLSRSSFAGRSLTS